MMGRRRQIIMPDERTKRNQHRYKLSSLRLELKRGIDYNRKTIVYVRVSSHDQKSDLE